MRAMSRITSNASVSNLLGKPNLTTEPTLRSRSSSWEFSMTSTSTGLHDAASLASA